jgi:hypothetical protein
VGHGVRLGPGSAHPFDTPDPNERIGQALPNPNAPEWHACGQQPFAVLCDDVSWSECGAGWSSEPPRKVKDAGEALRGLGHALPPLSRQRLVNCSIRLFGTPEGTDR